MSVTNISRIILRIYLFVLINSDLIFYTIHFYIFTDFTELGLTFALWRHQILPVYYRLIFITRETLV